MFTLIDLPYAPDALEPVISAQTLSFHHGKHLQTYVDNLNKLIAGTEFENMPLEEIIVRSSLPSPTGNPAIFNNAGQVYNHNMYFGQFRPFSPADPTVISSGAAGGVEKSLPSGALLSQIEKQWGTFDAFKAEFEAKGVGLFGSGWAWLASDSAGTLFILQCPNAGSPLTHVMPGSTGHLTPILTFDVWEHAYYLDYQNRRAAQLKDLWKIVDWKIVGNRYDMN